MAKHHLAERGQSEGARLAVDLEVKSFVSPELTPWFVFTSQHPLFWRPAAAPLQHNPNQQKCYLRPAWRGWWEETTQISMSMGFLQVLFRFAEVFHVTDPKLGALTLPNPLHDFTLNEFETIISKTSLIYFIFKTRKRQFP